MGVTPVQIARLHRDRRYQIIPAISSNSFCLAVADGPSQNLFSDRIEQLCAEVGVKLLYLPSYSLDLNPIEEFFAELKAFIRRN